MADLPRSRGVSEIAASLALACVVVAAPASAVDLQPRPGDPLPALDADQLERWVMGRTSFEANLSVENGLGPIFNQTSCGSCHNNPVGGPGTQTVTRFGRMSKKGGFDPLAELGGSLLQAQAIDDAVLEIIPEEADVISLRVTNGILAAGLIEAISDEDLLANRDAQPEELRGEAHMVSTFEDPNGPLRVGRFGWKAQVATVLTFSADAAQNEMGLSNRFLPFDNAPNGDMERLKEWDNVPDPEDLPDSEGVEFIDRVTDFQRFVAQPPQTPRGAMSGEGVFMAVGCAICHTPTFTTANDPALEDALRDQVIHPYGDFLLHDMGAAGDGIEQGAGGVRELKTPPLWGMRYRSPLWHDGRFLEGTFEERVTDAIMEHGAFGSQGVPSAEAFAALPTAQKQQLLAFLDSLGRVEFDGDGDGDVGVDDFHGYSDTTGFRGCFDLSTTPDDPCAVHDVNQDGMVDMADFKQFLVALDTPPADCNGNGIADLREILMGAADDDNDGILDECEPCVGDVNADGSVDITDILAVIGDWGPCDGCPTDLDGNAVVDVTDLLTLLQNWGPCP